MSNQKCPQCGLVNWAEATECKRCHAPLQQFEETHSVEKVVGKLQGEKPQRVIGAMMIVWGLLILAAGLFLLTIGGIDPVLLFGPAILISGILVMRAHPAAMVLYFFGVLAMGLWVAVTEGVGTGLMMSFFPLLIGLTKKRLPVVAGILIGLSCLAFTAMILMTVMLKPVK